MKAQLIYIRVARTDARIQAPKIIIEQRNNTRTAGDDGKVLYWDNTTGSFQIQITVTEADTIDTVLFQR